MSYSTGRQEYLYGAVLLWKNLQASASETNMIIVKGGRCLSITGRRDTITLL